MKYRITDQQTGRTLVISGDSPPTEQESEQLFQQSGIRKQVQPQEQGGFLQSKTIPVIGSILGGGIGALAGPATGIAGAGAGYAGGDIARKSLMNLLGMSQIQTPIESVTETTKGAGTMAGLQATGVGLGKVLPYLNPFKTAGALRNIATKKATEKGIEISGNEIVSAVDKIVEKAPTVWKEDVVKLAETAKKTFSGKNIDISSILEKKSASGDVGFLQRSGAQVRGVDAWFEREMIGAINKQLSEIAPAVKSADKLFSLLYGGKREIGGAIKRTLPYIVLGKMLRGY